MARIVKILEARLEAIEQQIERAEAEIDNRFSKHVVGRLIKTRGEVQRALRHVLCILAVA